MTDTPNAAQITYWNEGAGPTWAALQVQLDRQLGPLGRATEVALKPQAGERLLDVGCGCGETSLELAKAVGASGRVTGVDISCPMLEIARKRAAETGAANVDFLEADAQTYALEADAYDGLFSRFGVMFFADPTAAFTNLRRALKPGGRLAFLCWRSPDQNPIMTLPMASVAHLFPPASPPEPGAPGPFAFADPKRVEAILSGAGFTDIAITPHDEKIGAGSLDDSLSLTLRVGPLGGMLREHPELRDQAIGILRETLSAHAGADGVKLGSATWIVTAKA